MNNMIHPSCLLSIVVFETYFIKVDNLVNIGDSTIYNNDKNLSYSVFDSIAASLSRCRCLCAVQ